MTEEGVCELMAYLWLKHFMSTTAKTFTNSQFLIQLAEVIIKEMEVNLFDDYRRGFQVMKVMFEEKQAKLLDLLQCAV